MLHRLSCIQVQSMHVSRFAAGVSGDVDTDRVRSTVCTRVKGTQITRGVG
jgi:hypothetical protein